MTDELENDDSQNVDDEVETSEEEDSTSEDSNELTDREKQFLARAKKAEGKLKEVKTSTKEPDVKVNKTNTEQVGLTREEAIFYAKGGSEDDLELAKKIAKVDNVSILVAMEDDLYKSKIAQREDAEKIKKNQLGSSKGSQTGSGHEEKPLKDMTRDEHIAHMKKTIPNLNG